MKLLCSDLDRTLLPNGESEESPLARPILWQLMRTHAMLLAYVSGRDLLRVLDAIEQYGLPIPDVIVADVGTSVYLRRDGIWSKSEQWESEIARDWPGMDTESVRSRLADVVDLPHQEADRQSAFKRSYYLPEHIDHEQLRERVEQRLRADGIDAALVFSVDTQRRLGLLDILPRRATKRDAIRYLIQQLQFDEHEVLYAGDSGNDVSALASRVPGVLVGNADAATRERLAQQIAIEGTGSSTYFARGGVQVLSSRPLNGHYAAGIVEGLLHFRPAYQTHLTDPLWLEQAVNGPGTGSGVSLRSA